MAQPQRHIRTPLSRPGSATDARRDIPLTASMEILPPEPSEGAALTDRKISSRPTSSSSRPSSGKTKKPARPESNDSNSNTFITGLPDSPPKPRSSSLPTNSLPPPPATSTDTLTTTTTTTTTPTPTTTATDSDSPISIDVLEDVDIDPETLAADVEWQQHVQTLQEEAQQQQQRVAAVCVAEEAVVHIRQAQAETVAAIESHAQAVLEVKLQAVAQEAREMQMAQEEAKRAHERAEKEAIEEAKRLWEVEFEARKKAAAEELQRLMDLAEKEAEEEQRVQEAAAAAAREEAEQEARFREEEQRRVGEERLAAQARQREAEEAEAKEREEAAKREASAALAAAVSEEQERQRREVFDVEHQARAAEVETRRNEAEKCLFAAQQLLEVNDEDDESPAGDEEVSRPGTARSEASVASTAPANVPETHEALLEIDARLKSIADQQTKRREELDAYMVSLQKLRTDEGEALLEFPADYDDMVELLEDSQVDRQIASLTSLFTPMSAWGGGEANSANNNADTTNNVDPELAKAMARMDSLDRILAKKTAEARALAREVHGKPESASKSTTVSHHEQQHSRSMRQRALERTLALISDDPEKHFMAKNAELAGTGFATLTPEEVRRVDEILQDEHLYENGPPTGDGYAMACQDDDRLREIDCRLKDMVSENDFVEKVSENAFVPPVKPTALHDPSSKAALSTVIGNSYLQDVRQTRIDTERANFINSQLNALYRDTTRKPLKATVMSELLSNLRSISDELGEAMSSTVNSLPEEELEQPEHDESASTAIVSKSRPTSAATTASSRPSSAASNSSTSVSRQKSRDSSHRSRDRNGQAGDSSRGRIVEASDSSRGRSVEAGDRSGGTGESDRSRIGGAGDSSDRSRGRSGGDTGDRNRDRSGGEVNFSDRSRDRHGGVVGGSGSRSSGGGGGDVGVSGGGGESRTKRAMMPSKSSSRRKEAAGSAR